MMRVREVLLADTNDKTPPTQVEGKSQLPPVESGLMSLEELDQIIIENDPEALKNIEDLKANSDLNSQNIEIFQYDELLEKQKRQNQFIQKIRLKMSLFKPWLKARVVEFGLASVNQLKLTKVRLVEQKTTFSNIVRFWSWKEKSLFAGLITLLGFAIFVFYFGVIKKRLFHNEELFITSLLGQADQIWDLKPEDYNDYFYNTVRIPKNIFNLRRMVINVKPSENSGSNPMVALELSLEATSREALVEIKDREGEILDRVQRSLEEMTYDEISGEGGRDQIEDRVRNQVNSILTLGKIRSVFIVGSIFKP